MNGAIQRRFDASGSLEGCFARVCSSEMTLLKPALRNTGSLLPTLRSTFQSTKYPYSVASDSANRRRAAPTRPSSALLL